MVTAIDLIYLMNIGIRRNETIVAGMAYRTNIIGKMVIEEIGFRKIKVDEGKRICEGLDFYSLLNFDLYSFQELIKFMIFILNDLKQKGFEIVYGSCREQVKPLFMMGKKHFKANFIDMKEINGDKEYFARIELCPK